MLGMVIFAFASNSNQSIIYQIVDRYFVFLVIGGLVMLIVGIVTRSIGKSKELKFNTQDNTKKVLESDK